MKKGVKAGITVFLGVLVLLLIIPNFQEIKNFITGEATQTVTLNISVGGPEIRTVYNGTLTGFGSGPNEWPAITDVIINFTAYTVAGAGYLDDSTAFVNITNDATRTNSSCYRYESGGNYANYTCNVTMFFWDGAGTWSITALIKDNESNTALNTSTVFTLGTRTSFVMSPSTLTWPGISPSQTNRTSNNDPILMNNTGNDIIDDGGITINSSNLRGETTSLQALWAGNFSVDWQTGGSACVGAACLECGGSVMSRSAFNAVTTANLTKGNFTVNDGTAQEEMYFCLRFAGGELSTQAYSTANETEWNWIVQIL